MSYSIFRLTSFLTSEDIGHNVFVTRGAALDHDADDAKYEIDTLRVFVWAREKIVGVKDPGAFVMACCELSGQILCYDETRFEGMGEEEVVEAMGRATEHVVEAVRGKVVELFKQQH